MKLVLMSDTHSMHREVKVPVGDILIHSGDFTNIGELHDIIDFNAWLGKLPHKHKIVISGNHELSFERNPSVASLLTNCIYLQHQECTVEGIRIFGSPYSPAFGNWAFNVPRGGAILKKWKQIPEGIDILITHGPCYDILDNVDCRYLGCVDLRNEVLNRIRPRLHVFGHIHQNRGKKKYKGIHFVNASICTEEYMPINKPIVITLGEK